MIDISALTSFKTPVCAKRFIQVRSVADLTTIDYQALPWMVVGGGSNVIFVGDFCGCIIKNDMDSLETIGETPNHRWVRAGAGLNWHQFVLSMNAAENFGLENLALIPGTVGAAPVQNIGAYGVEIAEFITEVEVFDVIDKTCKTLITKDCQFSYRNSIFKTTAGQARYIIIAVIFCLNKHFTPNLSYRDLQINQSKSISCSTTPAMDARALIDRVVAIRERKLPDPAKLPNIGSFFKNPIIDRKHFQSLQRRYPDLPSFTLDDPQQLKVSAAWLIEQSGLKGICQQGVAVYAKHALILVNQQYADTGRGATGEAVLQLATHIIATVQTQFAVTLEIEPRIIA